MSGQSDDKVHTLIENSKQLIARLNELLAKASCKATSNGEIVSFKSIPVKS